MSYADFLILYYLAQSMDKKNFGELMHAMACDMPIVHDRYGKAALSSSMS